MSASFSLSKFVANIRENQGRFVKAHSLAIQAKWLAHLITRLQGADLDAPITYGTKVITLREIAERLNAVCYVGTPDGTLESIGQAEGVDEKSVLNLTLLSKELVNRVLYAETSFGWINAHQIIKSLGADYTRVSREACARFGFNWQEREQLRLAVKQYQPLPWGNQVKPIDGHFAHISTKQKGLIAYTETTEKGERDVQKQIKPGKYLKEFYPKLAGADIELLQGAIAVTELQFTSDPDQIEKLYTEGPDSCMSGRKGHKGGHPARCYGGGDLAVAYLLDKSGKCNARAVVWPEKKRYYCCYGDYVRINAALKKLGYAKADRTYPFQGARMRMQPNTDDTILMASFDGHGRFSLDPNDENFIIVDQGGNLYGDGQAGRMRVPKRITCQCGCGGKDVKMTLVYPDGRHKPSHQWLAGCVKKAIANEVLVTCAITGTIVPKADTDTVFIRGRNENPGLRSARQSNCIRTHNGRWYYRTNYSFVCFDNGEVWELTDLQKSAAHRQDPITGEWKLREEAKIKEKQAA